MSNSASSAAPKGFVIRVSLPQGIGAGKAPPEESVPVQRQGIGEPPLFIRPAEKIPDAGVVLPHPAGESVKARTVLPKDLGQGLVHRCRPADVPDENGPPAGTQDPAALPRKGRTVEPVEGLGRCDHVHGPVRQPGIMVRSI